MPASLDDMAMNLATLWVERRLPDAFTSRLLCSMLSPRDGARTSGYPAEIAHLAGKPDGGANPFPLPEMRTPPPASLGIPN